MATLTLHAPHGERRFALVRHITRIGADPSADVVLLGNDVADDHAQIMREGEAFVATCLGIGRSLTVNGKRVRRARLGHGDTLHIGAQTLTFRTRDTDDTQARPTRLNAVDAYDEIVAFSEKLLEQRDLDTLLTTLIDTVVELSQADRGFLILFDDAGQPHIHVARNTQRETLGDAAQQLSDSVVAKVMRDGKPVIVCDATQDNEFKSSASVLNLRLFSVMCVPLREAGHLLGIIYLGSNRVTHLFEPATLDATTVFAAQASLLIRNARLLDGLRHDNASLRGALQARQFGDIIGTSDAMQEVFRTVRKVAPTSVSVLLNGETGTGKELVAQEIHRRSPRASGPFVAINCGAMAETLLESELFGHVRGAFTGAIQNRDGVFQQAHSGTLFLDEIGEMPLHLQVKLLRALQDKMITRVGDHKPVPVDIRIIAATHRDIERAVAEGTFREDLYYRLHVVGIRLPPLCERGDDVVLIARYLLKRFSQEHASPIHSFTPQALHLIKRYRWPGNVRQLENRIKKAVIMAEGSSLTPEDMALSQADMEPIAPLAQAKEAFSRRYINEVLARNNGNRTKTAHDLGVDPRTVFRHIEREQANAGSDAS